MKGYVYFILNIDRSDVRGVFSVRVESGCRVLKVLLMNKSSVVTVYFSNDDVLTRPEMGDGRGVMHDLNGGLTAGVGFLQTLVFKMTHLRQMAKVIFTVLFCNITISRLIFFTPLTVKEQHCSE